MMYTFAFWICFSVCFDLQKAIPFISAINAYSYALLIYAFDSLFIIRGHCLGKVFPLTPPAYSLKYLIRKCFVLYTLAYGWNCFQLFCFTK